jgi:hypothetical protein
MDYPKLKALDAQEPYASMAPEAAADALNAATVTTRRLVPLWQIAELGRTRGWWYAVVNSTNEFALAFMEYYADLRFDNLDMDLQRSKDVVAGLVQATLLTQAQADEVDGLANVTNRLVESLGIAAAGEQIVTPQIRRVRS